MATYEKEHDLKQELQGLNGGFVRGKSMRFVVGHGYVFGGRPEWASATASSKQLEVIFGWNWQQKCVEATAKKKNVVNILGKHFSSSYWTIMIHVIFHNSHLHLQNLDGQKNSHCHLESILPISNGSTAYGLLTFHPPPSLKIRSLLSSSIPPPKTYLKIWDMWLPNKKQTSNHP